VYIFYPELQSEIPAQGGKYNTNRITEAGESGNTKTDGTKSTCLFCYGRKSRRGKAWKGQDYHHQGSEELFLNAACKR